MNDSDDPVPHDPWLREALRHAPDADAAPPAKVNEAILRLGRASVAVRAPRPAPPPPGWFDRLGEAWSWLARPPVAAAFAGLMVATVVGVMWWGRPLEEALPPREAPAVASVPTPPPAATAIPPVQAEAPVAAKAAATEPPQRKAAPPLAAAKPEPAPAPTEASRVAELTRQKQALPAIAAGAAAPATAPAPTAEAVPALRGGVERRELAAAAAPPPAPLADAARASALTGRADAAAAPARATAGSIETPGLSNLRFEIKPRPQAWSWQRDDGAARPMDDAMQNWIALADRTARPHWNPGTAAGEGAATTLRFLRDGQLKATLRIGPRGLRLDRGGTSESAGLAAAQTATLSAALDALGP